LAAVNRSKQLGESRISSLLIQFSLPAMVGMIVNASYNVIDRIFIGRGIGTLGIAGVTIGFPMMLVMMAFSMLIGLGGAALISIKMGEQKHGEAERVLGNGMVLLVINSLAISILGLLFLDPLLRFFGSTNDILPYARDYMRIIIGGAIFQGVSFGANAFIRAEGNPRIAMATMLIGAGLNAILAPIFIFVFKWGMTGAGLATVTAQMVSATWVLLYFLLGQSHIVLRRDCMRLKVSIVKTIIAIGSAPFAMQIAGSVLMIVLNHSLEKYGGDTAISAMGIVMAISMMIMMPVFGINQGSQPIIGFNYGARKFDRVIRTLKLAIMGATLIVCGGFILIRLFPTWIIGLFNSKDIALIAMGSHALIIYLTLLPLIGFQVVCSSYFLAVGKPKLSMILTLSRQVIFLLPALLILPRYFGLNGVFYAGPCADLLSTIMTGIFIASEIRLLRRQHNEPKNQLLNKS
jgi:putative MATE family efflux protein